jgi:hypothetical protein
MAQLRDDAAVAMPAKRFVAETVFGVVVTPRNVTVFAVFFDHAPVKVQTRKTLSVAPCNLVGIDAPPARNG